MNAIQPSLQTRALIVLGPFRGGTSVTCGILHALGVFVGKQFFDARNKYCTFEAVGLRAACNRCFDEFPTGWTHRADFATRVRELADWMKFARLEAARRDCIGVGGKHPTLCKMVDEAAVAFRNEDGQPPLFVSVIRPISSVLCGWNRATNADGGPWWPRPDREQVVADLIDSRDRALENHEHVKVDFQKLRVEPANTISLLAEQCGLSDRNLDQAIAVIRKDDRRGHSIHSSS